MHKQKVVVLGGGTGSFTLLQGLKQLTPNITAIVSMSDDGGSTGVLRDELGVLPPGDVRQCLVALSDTPALRDLFSYRFSDGSFTGHSLGNIILSGLELQYGSFNQAIQVASDILRITGRVLPVTLDKHTLVVEDEGKLYHGQHMIDVELSLTENAVVRHEPAVSLNPEAERALQEADMIVIAPGSFYTSLLPLLAVDGMKEALQRSKAKLTAVINLVNKPGQTDGWHVVDYIQQLERYVGKGRIDYALYNNEVLSPTLVENYASEGEYPVKLTLDRFMEVDTKAIGLRLISKEISAQQEHDKVRRSYIRHDAARVAKAIESLLSHTH
jgi:uncharacterized cofD-like protein